MRAQRTALLRITHGSPSKREGKNSHRHGFAATPPSKREASYNHSRKQNRILRPRPTFAHTCAYDERVNAARYYVAIAPQRENTRSAAGVSAGCLSKSRHFRTAALAKKISQKDFLRRGAASVLSAAFGAAEPPAGCAPPRRRQFGKICEYKSRRKECLTK